MIVAVYGTLRRGQRANNLLDGCRFLASDKIRGDLYDLGAYPGLKVDGNNRGTVEVELYQLPDDEGKTLRTLDWYEGEGSLYLRQEVVTLSGTPCSTYVYNYALDGAPPIPNGDWIAWVTQGNSRLNIPVEIE